jgi:CRISPR-associated protein Cas5d
MGKGIRVKTWGDFALFSRPEFKAERVSYDVMTPSAARGILEAIHWKPAIAWVIDRIHVLNPIRLDSLRRNEVGGKLPYAIARQATAGEALELALYADEARQQRASLLLRDVAYVIEAHFTMTATAGKDENPGKHADMARRRIERGQCVQQPSFGCREFPAYFEPVAEGESIQVHAELKGRRDLGWMLHDLDFSHPDGPMPHFFRAELVDGVLTVPARGFGVRI